MDSLNYSKQSKNGLDFNSATTDVNKKYPVKNIEYYDKGSKRGLRVNVYGNGESSLPFKDGDKIIIGKGIYKGVHKIMFSTGRFFADTTKNDVNYYISLEGEQGGTANLGNDNIEGNYVMVYSDLAIQNEEKKQDNVITTSSLPQAIKNNANYLPYIALIAILAYIAFIHKSKK